MNVQTIEAKTSGRAFLRNGFSTVTAIQVRLGEREAEIQVRNSTGKLTVGKLTIGREALEQVARKILDAATFRVAIERWWNAVGRQFQDDDETRASYAEFVNGFKMQRETPTVAVIDVNRDGRNLIVAEERPDLENILSDWRKHDDDYLAGLADSIGIFDFLRQHGVEVYRDRWYYL